MFFDYHLHSHFSTDSNMNLDQLCQAAVKIGLDEIAVTDHHDIDYQDDKIEFLINKTQYLQAIEKAQKKYENKLTIKKGIEMGLQSHIFEESKNYLGDDFDFIIGSFHTAEKADLYNGDFFKNYSQWEAYIQYLKTVLKVVQNYDHYSVIGHLDIIRRYGGFDNKPDLLENNEAKKLLEKILKVIIKKGKGIEVNTSGFKLGDENPLPSFEILKLYKKLEGEILTIGSDSHSPKELTRHFEFTKEKLKEIGFKKLATFKNMEPEFHKIS